MTYRQKDEALAHDDGDTPRVQSAERDALIAAASEVLARSGWWGFKVESVLRQAQLSTRSFYREFDTKDDLLAAVVERDLLRVAAAVDDIIDREASLTDRFWQYINALIAWGFDANFSKPATLFARSLRGLRPSHAEQVDRCMSAMAAPLAAVLSEGTRRGDFPTQEPEADARVVVTLIGTSLYDGPATGAEAVRAHLRSVVVPFIARSFQLAVPSGGLPALSD